jgi:hypothetical protein
MGVTRRDDKPSGNEQVPEKKESVNATHPTLKFVTKRAKSYLVAQGLIGNKVCLVAIDTGECVGFAGSHNVAGRLERKPRNVTC